MLGSLKHDEIIVETKSGLGDMGTWPPFNGAKSASAISPATESFSQKESSPLSGVAR